MQSEYITIPLISRKYEGLEALISAEDFESVSRYKWNPAVRSRGTYAVAYIRESGKTVLLHRFIMNPDEGRTVDHINGDGLDNRRCNLRVATHAENGQNAVLSKRGTSGYKGIYFHRGNQMWHARIRHNGTVISLRYWNTPEDAAIAYDNAAREMFGEFARVNFPREGELPART